MRILRFDDTELGHCGTDYHPQEGVACDGKTAPVPVCGMCVLVLSVRMWTSKKFQNPTCFARGMLRHVQNVLFDVV